MPRKQSRITESKKPIITAQVISVSKDEEGVVVGSSGYLRLLSWLVFLVNLLCVIGYSWAFRKAVTQLGCADSLMKQHLGKNASVVTLLFESDVLGWFLFKYITRVGYFGLFMLSQRKNRNPIHFAYISVGIFGYNFVTYLFAGKALMLKAALLLFHVLYLRKLQDISTEPFWNCKAFGFATKQTNMVASRNKKPIRSNLHRKAIFG